MKKGEKETTTEEPVVAPQKKKRGGGDVVAAFLLIFVGLLFLANNLGLVPWTVWIDLWKFWPIILILLGVQFLLGKSTIAQIVMAIITVSLLILISFFILASAGVLQGTGLEKWSPVQTMRTNEVVKQDIRVTVNDFQNVQQRKISIDNGVGKFVLKDEDTNDYFTLHASSTDTQTQPKVAPSQDGETLTIAVRAPGNEGPNFMPMQRKYAYNGVIAQPNIPTDIELNIGAGETIVELDTVKTQSFSINVGAGSATIALKDAAIPTQADLDIGVGSITFSVPNTVGLEVVYDVGLGNLKIADQNLRGNGTYKSQNFDQAERKLRISAHVRTGSITIAQ